jgi:hypothetical protein
MATMEHSLTPTAQTFVGFKPLALFAEGRDVKCLSRTLLYLQAAGRVSSAIQSASLLHCLHVIWTSSLQKCEPSLSVVHKSPVYGIFVTAS